MYRNPKPFHSGLHPEGWPLAAMLSVLSSGPEEFEHSRFLHWFWQWKNSAKFVEIGFAALPFYFGMSHKSPCLDPVPWSSPWPFRSKTGMKKASELVFLWLFDHISLVSLRLCFDPRPAWRTHDSHPAGFKFCSSVYGLSFSHIPYDTASCIVYTVMSRCVSRSGTMPTLKNNRKPHATETL